MASGVAWAPPDYYSLFGVDASASADHIRKAYHRLALATHPDKVGASGVEEFQRMQEGYEVLRDTDRRSEYDHILELSRRVADLRRAAAEVDFEVASRACVGGGASATTSPSSAVGDEDLGSAEKAAGDGARGRGDLGRRSRVDEALRRRSSNILF